MTALETTDGIQQIVEKEQIMGCRLDPTEVPEALWVFNKWVAMRTTDQATYFYEKPTLLGNTEPPMTMDFNNITMV